MLKVSIILLSQLLFINSNPIVEPSLPSLASSTIFENIAFIKLGTYRGFTNDGAEYHKTYFVSRFSRPSWAESRSFCNSYNMEFLTIETQAESQAYLNLLNTNSYLKTISSAHFWTDGVTVTPKTKTEWFWTKTGNKISFPISWYPTEPNNGNGSEYCLLIFKVSVNGKFTFGDTDCNALTNTACQRIDFLIP